MAYNKDKIFEQSKSMIKEHGLFFIEDIVAYLPCTKPTFYEFFPPESNELNYLKELLERKEELIRKKVHKLSLEELEFRTRFSYKESSRREVLSAVYERDQNVSEYAKRKANGICQLCNQPAPFRNLDGEPHLESHHIERLADDGLDTIENTVALCPNCHRKMHILNLPTDVAILKEKSSPKR